LFLLGYSVSGTHIHSVSWGIRQAIVQYIAMLGGTYISAFVINALAERFGVQKNFDRAFSLVAYTYTPMFVAGIFYILQWLSGLVFLGGLYGLYLLYIGLQPTMKVSTEKQTSYFVISLITMIVVLLILPLLLGALLIPKI
jgi:hypothetical protein